MNKRDRKMEKSLGSITTMLTMNKRDRSYHKYSYLVYSYLLQKYKPAKQKPGINRLKTINRYKTAKNTKKEKQHNRLMIITRGDTNQRTTSGYNIFVSFGGRKKCQFEFVLFLRFSFLI